MRTGLRLIHLDAPIVLLSISLCVMTSCRPAMPGRSKLWSVRTADDFDRLVKNGRAVADVVESQFESRLAISSGIQIGGLNALAFEMDEDNEAVVRATFDTRQMAPVSLAALRSFCIEFISRARSEIKVELTELKPIDIKAGKPNQMIVGFTREISGVPVRDSQLVFVFGLDAAGQFRLMEIENRTWGHIKPESRPSGVKLSDEKISQVIRSKNSRITASRDGYRIESVAHRPRLLPTTWYEVMTEDGLQYTLTFSGGDEPALVEAFPHRYSAVLEANAFLRNWSGPTGYYPVPDVTIEGPSGKVILDNSGKLPPNFNGGRVSLRSQWARFLSEAGHPTAFDIVNEGGRTIIKQGAQGVESSMNAYVALGRLRAFTSRFLTVWDVPYLKRSLRVTTDIPEKCNAYYQGLTLSFFAKGGNCANMALVNDVVYHEWGHGLDDYTGPGAAIFGGGMTDGAFSEGIGDIVAMFMNGDSDMGVGFFTDNPSKPIRRLENKKIYVPGQASDTHSQGTIIGGAFWELRKRMINKYGDAGHEKAAALFFSHLQEADSYLSSYRIVQRLADDDNNTVTRHSDWCLINHAFASKGLTKEDPCTDDFATSDVGGESKIFASLVESANPDLTPLIVSAGLDQAESVKICQGREPCANPKIVPVQNTIDGYKIFVPVSVKASEGALYNAEAIDATGRSLGRRVIKFSKK